MVGEVQLSLAWEMLAALPTGEIMKMNNEKIDSSFLRKREVQLFMEILGANV